MKSQVAEMTFFGINCMVETRPRCIIITTSRPRRHEITARTIEEGVYLLDQWLHQRPRSKTRHGQQNQQLEDAVRESLRIMRLPNHPIPITGRHVVASGKGGLTRYIVRRTMDGHGRLKLYFGSYASMHAAARASVRLCEIINEEIVQRQALLSVKNSKEQQ